jgi:predicted ATPase/DNA-binding winged helix-turn-helix (wHTH) protein
VKVFASFGLDARNQCLWRLHENSQEERVLMTPKAFAVLAYLVEHAGSLVRHDELLEAVWPDVVVEPQAVKKHVLAVRSALGDSPRDSRFIETVPKLGYRFIAPIREIDTVGRVAPTQAARDAPVPERSRLPPQLERMIGRDDEVAALRADLLRERFVTIVGPGGMGKTTVAISVAHALADEFPDYAAFVDLAAIAEPSMVTGMVAAALGMAVHLNDPEPGIVAFLQSRRALVVLDNCEHVIAAAAALAERIHLAAPKACILATSREPLRVEGEHVRPLMPLPSPDDTSSLTAAEALAFPAVQLFVERAAASTGHFDLTDEDARDVATICRNMDGIALALELAAGRVAAHGIRGTAQLLDLRFRLLWQGRRTAQPRHQTLSALLDWSFNLLEDQERAVLSRLSVFVGTFSLRDAEAVAGEAAANPGQLAEVLTSLVAKSLVSIQARAHDRPRYRLLEVTRAYAAAKLDVSGESESIRRRHAVHFSRAEADLNAFDLGNVRAALAWCFARPDEQDVGRDLVLRAAPVFLQLSLLAECQRWTERALVALPETDRGSLRELDLLQALAICSMFTRGNDAEVQAVIERGLQLAEHLGDGPRQEQFLAGLNIFCTRIGDFAGALRVADRAVVVARSLNDADGTVIADWMLGVAYHLVGDQRAGQRHCESVLDRNVLLHKTRASPFGFDHRIRALITLARTLWLRGAVDRAAGVAQEAVDEGFALDQPVSLCIALMYSATVYLWRGDWLAADRLVARGLAESKKHSLEPYHAAISGLQGELLLRQGQLAAAIDLLRRASADLVRERHVVLAPLCCCVLTEALASVGEYGEALATIEQAMSLREGSGGCFDMPEMLRVKAGILMLQPQATREALTCLERAMDLAQAQSALSWELRIALTQVQAQPTDQTALQRLGAIRARFSEGSGTVDQRLADQWLS